VSGRVRRGSLALVDQGVSALGNVILVLVLARQTTASGFGAFALGYAVYVVTTGVSRALSSEPLIVLGAGRDDVRDLVSGSLATSLAVGAVALLVGVGGGLVFDNPSLVTMAVFFPLLTLEDAARMALLSAGRPGLALTIDTVWTVGQCVLFALITTLASGAGGPAYVAAWGVAGALGAVVGLRALRQVPRPGSLSHYWSQTPHLRTRYTFEYLSGAGALQLIHFGIGAVLGLAAIGALRAAQSLLGPFNQLLTGLSVGLMPELVRLRRERHERLVRATALISTGAVLVVVVGTLVLSGIPDSWGRALLGDTWSGAQQLLVPAGAAIAANMAIVGPLLGLRALARPRSSLRARMVGSLLAVVGAGIALVLGGSVLVVAWVIAGAVWIGAIGWWVVFLREPVGPLLSAENVSDAPQAT
jgi:O-antigen/teichoic acid export membrane protein